MKIRPYNWRIIGPWLRRRASEEGASIAEGVYLHGIHPMRILRYANKEIIRAAAQHSDARLHYYIGMALRAGELAEKLEETTP